MDSLKNEREQFRTVLSLPKTCLHQADLTRTQCSSGKTVQEARRRGVGPECHMLALRVLNALLLLCSNALLKKKNLVFFDYSRPNHPPILLSKYNFTILVIF